MEQDLTQGRIALAWASRYLGRAFHRHLLGWAMFNKNDLARAYINRISSGGLWQAIALILIVAIPAIVFVWVTDQIFLYHLSQSYVDDIAKAFNLNKYLAQAITIVVFIVFVFFVGKIGISKTNRAVSTWGITLLLVAYYLAMSYGTGSHKFDTQGNAIKCYVLTRDGGVRWLEPVDVDPLTGLKCRKPTPELVERLNIYIKGKLPQRVGDDEVAFFDPRTSEPIVWYWKAKSGDIEIFNLMGFHPETRDELLPVTPDIVEQFKAQRAQRQRRQRPLRQIAPETYDFFDPATGEARAWYWRSDDGTYEFYDNSGFHPQTGTALKPVDNDVLTIWREEKKAAEARQSAVRLRQANDARLEADRQERERRAELEREQREAQAGVSCDQLAGNPSDPHRSGEVAGVRYDELKVHATEAVQACRIAREKFPNELRYQYQYARALEINDPGGAIPLYRELIRQNYPAAYDNLGNIYIRKRDMKNAIVVLQAGVAANDPDSMVTLSVLIENGYLSVPNPSAAKYALLSKAAQLGHSGAQVAVDQQRTEFQQGQQERAYQQQEQQMMLDIFRTILHGVPR